MKFLVRQIIILTALLAVLPLLKGQILPEHMWMHPKLPTLYSLIPNPAMAAEFRLKKLNLTTEYPNSRLKSTYSCTFDPWGYPVEIHDTHTTADSGKKVHEVTFSNFGRGRFPVQHYTLNGEVVPEEQGVERDENGFPVKIEESKPWGKGFTHYIYDSEGRLTNRLANNNWESLNQQVYSYNNAGFCTRTTFYRAPDIYERDPEKMVKTGVFIYESNPPVQSRFSDPSLDDGEEVWNKTVTRDYKVSEDGKYLYYRTYMEQKSTTFVLDPDKIYYQEFRTYYNSAGLITQTVHWRMEEDFSGKILKKTKTFESKFKYDFW